MSYVPDTRNRIAKATRFFARLESFSLECPACGDVYVIRQGATRKKGAKSDAWDSITGRFTCTNKECGRHYVLGILAWPIIAAPRVATATPEDQVPGPRQLTQLRKEGGGWWLSDEDGQRYPRPKETNLTTEENRPDDDDE